VILKRIFAIRFQPQNSFWVISLMSGVTILLAFCVVIPFYWQTGRLTYLSLIIICAVVLAVHSVAWWLARLRKHFDWAISPVLVSQVSVAIVLPIFISNYWVVSFFLLFLVPIELVLARQPQHLSLAIIVVITSMAVIVGIDLWALPIRIELLVEIPASLLGAAIFFTLYLAFLIALCKLFCPPLNDPHGKRFDISTQMSLFLTAVLATSILLVTGVLITQIRTLHIKMVGQELQTLAEVKAEQVGDILSQQIDLLTALSRQETILLEALDTANNTYPRPESDIRSLLQKREKQWQTLPENNPFFRQYRYNQQTLTLNRFRNTNPLHSNLLLTDRHGGVVAAQGEKPERFFYGAENWWQTAWNNGWGGIYTNDLALGSETKTAHIFIAIGVFNPQTNETSGVLASTYELKIIQREIKNTKLENNHDISLASPDGRIIAGLDENHIGRPIWSNLSNLKDMRIHEHHLASSSSGWLMGPNIRNEPVVQGYARISTKSRIHINTLGTLGWYVVAGNTQENALAEVTHSTKIASLVALLTMLFVALVAMIITRIITKPIAALTRTAAAISAGDLEQRAEPSGPLELVTLAQSFNTLTSRLRALINNLQEQVAQRTAQLEARAEQLARVTSEAQEARDEAEAANNAKSQFLASMSHELRTPLNGILGYTQILSQHESLTEHQQKGLSVIHQSGEHLLLLINDILDLSKIEAGKMELQLERFHMPDFLKGLAEILGLRCEQKGVSFISLPFDFTKDVPLVDPLPPVVYGDAKRLRQVLINLLGNAVKFTQVGKVTFKFGPVANESQISEEPEEHKDEKAKNMIRFQVEDTGGGIDAKHLETIFDPFHQAPDQGSRGEGTGLGLSISRNLVHLMGGEIKVESTPGKGSVFWFDVQLPPGEDEVVIAGINDDIVGYKGPKRRILVVDDMPENRMLLVDFLTPLDFDVISAADGREGLDKAATFKPDAILVDLIMPVMDGYEFTHILRDSATLKNTILIAISADVFEDRQQKSHAAGCDDFIPKPVQARTLLQTLQHHLDLEWTYDRPKAENETRTRNAQSPISLMPFRPKEAAFLYNLAMMGDIKAIQSHLVKLEQRYDRLHPLITRLQQLSKRFKMDEICEVLEPYLEKQDGIKSTQ
jgi:signal transduction histidine kinase/FixJ family two-component response regulator